MKELILIRHGEAEHLVGELTGGWTDTSLTNLGRAQATLTGKRLAEMIGDRNFQFYTSDLKRAHETAKVIGDSLGRTPFVRKELRELNNGAAANRTKEEAKQLELPVTHPPHDWVPYPGAESWRHMMDRIYAFMSEIDRDRHGLTLLVAHGNVGVAIVHWWLGLGEEEWSRISFDLDPCSVTHFRINKWGDRTIVRLNDVSHLVSLSIEPEGTPSNSLRSS